MKILHLWCASRIGPLIVLVFEFLKVCSKVEGILATCPSILRLAGQFDRTVRMELRSGRLAALGSVKTLAR